MFRQIVLENFKGFRRSGPIPLRPLTLLIGKNNSGKSTVFHALLALKQTLEDRRAIPALVTSGERVDLGAFGDVRHKEAQADEGIRIKLSLDDTSEFHFPRRTFKRVGTGQPDFSLDMTFKFDGELNRVVLSSVIMAYGDDEPAYLARAGKGYRAPRLPSEFMDHASVGLINFLPTLRTIGEQPSDENLVNAILNASFKWTGARSNWWLILESYLQHVSPIRASIPRVSLRGEAPGMGVGQGGAALLRDLRSDENIQKNQTLLEYLRDWITEEFGLLKDVRFEPLDNEGNVKSFVGDELHGCSGINIASMGSGISQILPIIAAAGETPNSGCLLVEQPELHLHPAAQSTIADLFIQGVTLSKAQFLVETHSEHILLRLRRRIAEGRINPEDVAVLFVDRIEGNSQVELLEIDSRGNLERWPQGFFSEDYSEALAIAKASTAK